MFLWVIFASVVVALTIAELVAMSRSSRARPASAVRWTGVWIALALLFNAGVYWTRGADTGVQWTTAYALEKALSVDNMYALALIVGSLSLTSAQTQRLLFWGVFAAAGTRIVLILAGGLAFALIPGFVFVFAAFAVFGGVELLWKGDKPPKAERNLVIRALTRFVPVRNDEAGDRFLLWRAGLALTPLGVTLLLIEVTDMWMAVESIPAIYAVSADPFVLVTSNVFAFAGMRSLYFAVAPILLELRYLKEGLAVVLFVAAAKLAASPFVKVDALLMLPVVALVLVVVVLASRLLPAPNNVARSATEGGSE